MAHGKIVLATGAFDLLHLGHVRFLCGEREFNEERVRTAVERAKSDMTKESRTQTLESFFHP